MEKKTYNKLAPKVKTLFHFSKKGAGSAVNPSNTTLTATTTISGSSIYIS